MSPVRNLIPICASTGLLVFSHAAASAELSREIAAQPLAQALSEFAAQTGLQVVYVSGIAATRVARRAPRGLAAPDALQRLLAGTGLRYEFLNDRTVGILADSSCATPSGCAGQSIRAATLADSGPLEPTTPDGPLEEVIVTGARWWLFPTGGTAPVTVLDRRDIERGGRTSIGDVLQALPMTAGSPLNTNANAAGGSEPRTGGGAAGDGSVRVRVHDLPTLILLNGRRLPNSGPGADTSVDLNTLPMSFIERVEVLASGASAAFGSDAVGGVVNIVTRRSDPGLELGGARTITERGDGEVITGQAVFGFDLFGGSWSLGVDYVEQDAVTMDRRSYSARPLIIVDADGQVSPEGLNNLAVNGVSNVPEGNTLGLEPGLYTRVPGGTGRTSADWRPYDRSTDGFNPAPFNYSQTPNERVSLWLLGSRPLGEDTTFFLEGLVHHRQSAQQAAPDMYFTIPAPTLADGSTGIPSDNYYNPFGVDLPNTNRRMMEAGNRRTEQEVDLWRALIGFEGSLAGWTWEVALQSAGSGATGVERRFLAGSRLLSALGPSGLDDSGHIVCGSPDPVTGRVPATGVIADCVPLNLFGGAGTVTEEQLAYLMPRALSNRGTNEQQLADLVLSGPGGRILRREAQWVLGASYRREAGSLAPDPLHGFVESCFPCTSPAIAAYEQRATVSADYDARELFAAVQVPLLHDRPWARDMVLNVGLRWSDFYSFDGHTTQQAGLRWQPAEELTLRAGYGEVFRAPGLTELFERPVIVEEFPFDPCGNDPTPAQRANCAANGVPDGAYVQDGWGLMAVYGGNPAIEPETGHTVGAGLVYTPLWAEGLSASVDYFEATLVNYISVATPDEMLFECAERGNLCDALTRLPEGYVIEAVTRYRNLGELEVRVVDIAINWSAMTRIGALNSRLLATYLDRWDRQFLPGGEVNSYAGTFDAGARPRWRASGRIDWRSGDWVVGYAADYIGSYSERVEPWGSFGIEFEPYYRRVGPVLYHDIEAAFRFESGITVRAAITNATNEDPPYLNIAPANTDVATYRLLGRSYFLELRYRVE